MTTAFCQTYVSAVKRNVGVKVVKEHAVTSIDAPGECDPQLVMRAFQKEADLGKSAVMVVGNLHIRRPNKKKAPKISKKQQAVRRALSQMEDHANGVMHHRVPAEERHQAALLLVGDCNLTEEFAKISVASLQRDEAKSDNDVWAVMGTAMALGGDICFARGCNSFSFSSSRFPAYL